MDQAKSSLIMGIVRDSKDDKPVVEKTDKEKVAEIKKSLSKLSWDKDEKTTLSIVKTAIKNIKEASVEENEDNQVVVTINVGNESDTITLKAPVVGKTDKEKETAPVVGEKVTEKETTEK